MKISLQGNEYKTIIELMPYTDKIKTLLTSLFDQLASFENDFKAKFGHNNTISIASEANQRKNIVNIFITKDYLRLKFNLLPQECQTMQISEEVDINSHLIYLVKSQHQKLTAMKKQISVYLDVDVYEKIIDQVGKGTSNINRYVVDALENDFKITFLDEKHEYEFYKFVFEGNLLPVDYSAYLEQQVKAKSKSELHKELASAYLISAYNVHSRNIEGDKFFVDQETGELAGPNEKLNFETYESLGNSYAVAAFKISKGETIEETLKYITGYWKHAISGGTDFTYLQEPNARLMVTNISQLVQNEGQDIIKAIYQEA